MATQEVINLSWLQGFYGERMLQQSHEFAYQLVFAKHDSTRSDVCGHLVGGEQPRYTSRFAPGTADHRHAAPCQASFASHPEMPLSQPMGNDTQLFCRARGPHKLHQRAFKLVLGGNGPPLLPRARSTNSPGERLHECTQPCILTVYLFKHHHLLWWLILPELHATSLQLLVQAGQCLHTFTLKCARSDVGVTENPDLGAPLRKSCQQCQRPLTKFTRIINEHQLWHSNLKIVFYHFACGAQQRACAEFLRVCVQAGLSNPAEQFTGR
jgi:hypothetical protein